MSSRPNAPLPALHHTAPACGPPSKRGLGKLKKNAFSLDNYFASTQPQTSSALSRSADATPVPPSDYFLHSDDAGRRALSPAEALLANDNALAPLPSASSAALSYTASWRSQLLQCETQLRELVAKGVHEPPSLERIREVVDLFDQVCANVQVQQGNAFLGNLLRLFRLEFCRAIFLDGSGSSSSNAAETEGAAGSVGDLARSKSGAVMAKKRPVDTGLPQTYFEETASLQRTKAALSSALADGASGETVLLLERQLEDRGEQLTWYESELERVRGQYEQVAEECLKLRKTLEEQQREAATTQKRLQQEIQSLHVENKDLQIQLFRLRKQIAGGMANLLKDNYRQLKLSKMGLTQRLFNEGDERIALLVLLSQVESRVNEILDAYDNDFVLTPETGQRDLQLKMAESVTVLLEDMHYCEASYRRLVGGHSFEIADSTSAGGNASLSGRSGDAGGGGNGGRTAPLQRIPVSLVHSGKYEEAPDESDGYVAILFDPKIYEHFQARHAMQERLQQYKREREESTKATRDAAQQESEGMFFHAVDGTFLTAAASAKFQARRQTLTTLLSGMFAAESLTGRGKPEQSNTGNDTAKLPAASTTTVPAAPEEKLKKWSLDSRALNTVPPMDTLQSPTPRRTPAATPHAPLQRTASKQRGGATKSREGQGGSAAAPQAASGAANALTTNTTASSSSQAATATTTTTGEEKQETLEEVVERQKAAWVAQILGPTNSSVAFTVPGRNPEAGDVIVVHEKAAEVVPAEMMMRRVLHHPMEDLCNERFLSTVEVYTGDNPTQQRLLCRVNHIDPALPIQVPESTNFVKVKYALTDKAVPPRYHTSTNGVASSEMPAAATAATDSAALPSAPPVFRGNPQLRLFRELSSKGLVDGNLGLQYCAGAVSSTTASTVAFQRLHPMSPNRPPEWLLYQQLFGAYRSLTPRMMEVTTIDHVMACAAERYFTRMEYRYDECYLRAAEQCTTNQLRRDMTERLFKDLHTLSDFQEALVDELESRYGFPELVAKVLYEMLCYLNAVCEKDTVLSSYLDVIRGFSPPTEVHFMAYMLYHLSYCWPESNPSTTVPVEDVRTVLEYVYRNASPLMPIKPDTILHDYDMATRSAPLNFVNFRQFIASTMAHQEESILLHLHGLFHAHTQRTLIDEAGWETYETVISKSWHQKDERRSLVRYLTSCLGVNRSAAPTLPQLTLLAASAWSSNLWE